MSTQRVNESTLPPHPREVGYTDQDGSEDDVELNDQYRDSVERARYDQEVLEDEEENEKLLMGQSDARSKKEYFRERHRTEREEKREARKRRRQNERDARRGRKQEKRELMHEMEEGGPRSATPSSQGSSEEDRERFERTQATRRTSRVAKICRYFWIQVLIAGLLIAIGFGAWKASRHDAFIRMETGKTLLSNGSCTFAPTTILVSLDGFRADFLQRDLTPELNAFIKTGVSPKYMLPSFPSVTFPNHFTLATGLYPESHGVVGNTFWAPELEEEFYYTHPDHSMQPKWWNGEPFWVTAEDQGVRTAIHMWPGSEAHLGTIEPAFLDKFNGSEALSRKVDRILELLDKPGIETNGEVDISLLRPQFIAAYVPNVDADGHKFGPNSTEINQTIKDADNMLTSLFRGLEERNLTEVVNVIVVSDHGMATTSRDRLIQYEDLVDPTLIAHIDGWPHYGLRPKDTVNISALHERLQEKATHMEGFDVYLRDKDMPERYHFSNNDRIAPLWIMPKTGWAIVTKDEYDVVEGRKKEEVYHPRGLHGYDHEHPLMRAIFVARGPAFPHRPNSRLDDFQNTEVYNIVCDSIGVEPRDNNGTLRLPLKPVGLHSDGPVKPTDQVHDFPETGTVSATSTLPFQPAETGPPSKNTTTGSEDEQPITDIKVWAHGKWMEFTDWLKSVFGIGEDDDDEEVGTNGQVLKRFCRD